MKKLLMFLLLSLFMANMQAASAENGRFFNIHGAPIKPGTVSPTKLSTGGMMRRRMAIRGDRVSLDFSDLSTAEDAAHKKIIGSIAVVDRNNKGRSMLQLAIAVCPIDLPNQRVKWERNKKDGFVTGILSPANCELFSINEFIKETGRIDKDKISSVIKNLSEQFDTE